MRLEAATGYTDTQTRRRVDTTVAYGNFTDLALGLPEGGSSYFDNGLDLQKFTQEFRLTSQGDGPFEWLVGAFYTRETGNNTQFIALNQLDGTPLPAPFDGIAGVLAELELPSRYEETAVFANGGYRFNDWFKLEAGVRYSENDQEFSQNVTGGLLLPIAESPGESSDDVFTWSVAPQFQVAEDVMVYARAATGYQPGGPNVVVTGLPPVVDSSTLTSYELGMKSTFVDNRLLFDVTAFRIDWRTSRSSARSTASVAWSTAAKRPARASNSRPRSGPPTTCSSASTRPTPTSSWTRISPPSSSMPRRPWSSSIPGSPAMRCRTFRSSPGRPPPITTSRWAA